MRNLASRTDSESLPGFGLQRLQFEPSGLGSLVVGTGRTLDPGVVRVSVQAHDEHLPLNFARTWDPGITVFGLVENKLQLGVVGEGYQAGLELGALLRPGMTCPPDEARAGRGGQRAAPGHHRHLAR
ncbi:MAG TPA: hypothetical protein VEZ71_12300 [Archangium sp.]|nr:hypothetical protein [Archangium sp.]